VLDADDLLELATDPSTEWVADPETVGAEAVSLLWTVFEADDLLELATDPSTEAELSLTVTSLLAEPEATEAVFETV
jgi:hypothetical protein